MSALDGVQLLGLDTAPLIYLIEQHPTLGPKVLEIARRIDTGALPATASVITLTEVLAQPLRLGRKDLVDAYRRLLEEHPYVSLIPIDAEIAVQAGELRARYSLRTPDALQVAAALRAGCDAFLTNDGDMRRISELRIVVLSDLA